jgi:hypothetical protein
VGADDWGRFKGGRPGILGVRAQRDPGGDFGRGELRERRLREEGEGPTGGPGLQRGRGEARVGAGWGQARGWAGERGGEAG